MSDLKAELIRLLETIPGVLHKSYPERADEFSTLHFCGKEIGHFHDHQELDLRLGKALIKKCGLKAPADTRYHPERSRSSHYIMLRFTNMEEVRQVESLVRLLCEELSPE